MNIGVIMPLFYDYESDDLNTQLFTGCSIKQQIQLELSVEKLVILSRTSFNMTLHTIYI